jgi:hypothetical protein
MDAPCFKTISLSADFVSIVSAADLIVENKIQGSR